MREKEREGRGLLRPGQSRSISPICKKVNLSNPDLCPTGFLLRLDMHMCHGATSVSDMISKCLPSDIFYRGWKHC